MDENKFLRAYDEYADAIFRHCFFRVSRREEAKDLTQEVFTRVWDYLARGGQIDNMKAFLFKTANNLIIDTYRKKSSASLDLLMEEGFDLPQPERISLTDRLDAKRVVALFAKLPDDYRQVLEMRFAQDLGPKTIAEILGVSENVVSVRLHRGIEKLKEFFT